jgi:hypothetical protein
MKKFALFLAALSTFVGSALAGPYDAWASYKILTVNTSALALGSNVSDFPLLVRLDNGSNASGANILSGSLTAGGLDVVFTDSTGNTALSFERERFSSTAAEFWVRVPVVNSAATNGGLTKIRVYWGKSAATNLSSGAGVFDKTVGTGNGHQAVYHMTGTDSNETNATGGDVALNLVSKNSGFTGVAPQVGGVAGFGRSLNATSISAVSTSGFATPAGMTMVNTTTGYAVGAAGSIRKTTNGGATWTTQASGTTNDLKGIACTSDQSCVAVGLLNTIVATTNGGTNWTSGTVTGTPKAGSNMYAVTFPFKSVNVISDTSGFIVGDSGQVFAITKFSTAPVYTLTALGAGGLAVYRAIACDVNTCFIGGDAGATRKLSAIATTAVGVATAAMAVDHNIKAVAYTGTTSTGGTPAANYSAVGDSAGVGLIYRPALTNNTTATNGLNRYKVTAPFLPVLPPLTGVAYGVATAGLSGNGANAYTAGWIVGGNGTVLRTLNSGLRWGQVASGTTQNLATLAVPMGTTATYAAYNGLAATASNTLLGLNGKFGQYFASGTLGTTTSSTTATDSSVLNFAEVGPFTVSAWVNPEYFDGAVHNITTKGDKAYVLQLDGSIANINSRWNLAVYGTVGGTTSPTNSYTNWYAATNGTATVASSPVATTGWHHIVGTKKSVNPALPASTELYVDGVLVNVTVPGTNTNTSADRTFTQLLTIGKTLDGGNAGEHDRYWMGGVDEFRYTSRYQDSSYNRLSYESQKPGAALLTQGAVMTPPPVLPTIAFSPSTVVDTVGKAATHAATTTGVITSCASTGTALPAGLTVNNTTCAVSGTPTVAAAAANYTITATNSTGSVSATLNLAVLIAKPTVAFTPSTVVDTVGKAATHTPTVTGTITSCAIAPAIPGLTVNSTTCAITGTPTTASASAAYTITATNSTGTGTATLTVTVLIAAPTNIVYAGDSATYKKDTAITTWTPTVTGTVTAWSISPALPAGLAFNTSSGAITGTPTAATASSANYTVTASNGTGSATKVIKITVQVPVGILPNAFILQVNGQNRPYAFTIPAGSTSEKVTLSILNTSGRSVWSKSVAPSKDKATEISWNGHSSNGGLASAGIYVVQISVLEGGKVQTFTRKAVTLTPR